MAKKVLFVTQEITPYVPETAMSLVGRYLPQAIQEDSHEIRTFMPRWAVKGCSEEMEDLILECFANSILDNVEGVHAVSFCTDKGP